jgi:flagellar hook-associated protein 3 FlgL
MRVSTAYMFDQNLSAMLNKQAELGKTQLQVSTGNRILNPSDDPAGSVQILNLQREVSLSEQYLSNATKAGNKQSSEEGVLDSATSMLQRIRELAVQGLNSTNTQADKQAIAIEVKQLNEQLLALANTRDSNGDYLFSGFKSNTPPYGTINGDYQGDEGQRNIKVGEGVLIETNDPGNRVFEAPLISTTTTTTLAPSVTSTLDPTSTATLAVTSYTGGSATFPAVNFTFRAEIVEDLGAIPPVLGVPAQYDLSDGINTATVDYTAGMNVDLVALNPNFPPMTVTLSGIPVDTDTFSVGTGTGSGQATITVDSGAGETFSPISFTYQAEIIADPLALPTPIVGVPARYQITDGSNTETVDYVDGMSVDLGKLNPNFTSLTVKLTGAPADGDVMVIERTETQVSQSMFKTIENFANALMANDVGPNSSPNNGDFLTNISASLGVVIDTRAKVGSRLNSIEQQNQINEGISVGMQKALSEIKDLDYAEAISRLSLQMTGLQAAQQSFAKVQGLSLFNYL